MKFPRIIAALAAAIPGLKVTDAVALDEAFSLDTAVKVKTVEDEFPDMSAEDRRTAMDAYSKKTGKALDSMTDGDKREAFKAARDGRPATGAPATGQAADAAIMEQRIADAVAAATKDMVTQQGAAKLALDAATAAREEVHALYTARHAVEPTVGVCALDSAEAIYRFALDHLKVDHKDTAAPGLAALYEASAKAAPAVALDSAPIGKFDPKILGLTHIRKS